MKLHYRRDGGPSLHRPEGVVCEFRRTTKKINIARVTECGKKPSPWFEVLDDNPSTAEKLVEWWCSGVALNSLMLR